MSVYRPQERRLVLRLMAYWDDMRGDREYPAAADIDPEAIGDDWPYCHLLELGEPTSESQFHHVGAELLDGAGGGASLTLGNCPDDSLLFHATHYLDRLLQKGVPVSIGGEAELRSGVVLYRSVMLPLASDGSKIDHILGAANCRLVAGDPL